jgi:hypothetical protein
MTYLITTRTATTVQTYVAIGDRNALMDAAYSAGALGIFVRVLL